MRIKKLAESIIVMMAFSLCIACGSEADNDNQTTSPETTTEVAETTEAVTEAVTEEAESESDSEEQSEAPIGKTMPDIPGGFDQAFEDGTLALEQVNTDFIGDDILYYTLSPDGTRLIGQSNNAWYVYNLRKETTAQLWYDEENSIEDIYGVREDTVGNHLGINSKMEFVWSPDGTKAILVSGYYNTVAQGNYWSEVYLCDLNTGSIRVIYTSPKLYYGDDKYYSFFRGDFCSDTEVYLLGKVCDKENNIEEGDYICKLNIETFDLEIISKIDESVEDNQISGLGWYMGICAQDDGTVLVDGSYQSKYLTILSANPKIDSDVTVMDFNSEVQVYDGQMTSTGNYVAVDGNQNAMNFSGTAHVSDLILGTTSDVENEKKVVIPSYDDSTAVQIDSLIDSYNNGELSDGTISIYSACFSPDEHYLLLLCDDSNADEHNRKVLLMNVETLKIQEIDIPEGLTSGYAGQINGSNSKFYEGVTWASENRILLNVIPEGGNAMDMTTVLMEFKAE